MGQFDYCGGVWWADHLVRQSCLCDAQNHGGVLVDCFGGRRGADDGKKWRQIIDELKLPENVWTKLSYAWMIFFILMGLINLAIAYPFTAEQVDVWAKYKMYGYIPLSLIFSIGQAFYIARFLPKPTGE